MESIYTSNGVIIDALFIKDLNIDEKLYMSQERLAIVRTSDKQIIRSLDIFNFLYPTL